MTPASSQDRIDAPPADFAAVRAPSNQPDPMIEPSEMNISALNPTVRRSPVPVTTGGPAVVDMALPGRGDEAAAVRRTRPADTGAFDQRHGAHRRPSPRLGHPEQNGSTALPGEQV